MAFLSTNISDSLTENDLDSLQKANIWTINDLLSADLMDIKRTTGIKFHILKELVEKVKQRYTLPHIDLNILLEKSIRECKMCPTGLPELTSALDGGFQTQEIIEFFGDTESGKTEICYLLCGEILSHYDDYHISYIASNFDFDHEKISKYIKLKAGARDFSEDDVFKALSRIDVARPTKLADLVHLLNTLVHNDRRNATKCIIVDSLSFIIQEDILDIRTANLDDAEELEKFCALKGIPTVLKDNNGSTVDSTRKEFIDIYLHEVMRLLINIAITKNVIVVLTNSDPQLTYSKSWTNAIDHRIHLSRMPEFSSYQINNPTSTVCRATILKTIHNIAKIGHSIPFAISDEGLFALRLNSKIDSDGSGSDENEPKC